MERDSSFEQLVAGLRLGQNDAAENVFRRYAQALLARAAQEIDARLRRKVDPEDVVQSAFRSFFRRQAAGQFDLSDWGGLWALLVCITVRKCRNLNTHYRRDGRDVAREATGGDDGAQGEEVLDREPTPAEAAVLGDLVQELMGQVVSQDRPIVEMRLQGYTPSEIADRTGRAERTVFRVLDRVRERASRLWQADEAEC
jgi:RNA polymerase sigma-70 factor (ECF subfamily)